MAANERYDETVAIVVPEDGVASAVLNVVGSAKFGAHEPPIETMHGTE